MSTRMGPGGGGAVPPLRCTELVEMLGDYLEGTLPPGAQADLEEHLRSCRGCSAALDQLQQTLDLLGASGLPGETADDLPDDVRAELVAAFEDLRGRGRESRGSGPAGPVGPAGPAGQGAS